MSAPSTSAPPPGRGTGNRDAGRNRLAFLAFAVAAALVVMAYMTITFGYIGGEEFSPDLFRRRQFHYWELPLFRVQVWPITRTDSTGALESYLRDNKLLSLPASVPKPRWDLVAAHRGLATRSIVARSEAQILCYYLDARDADGNYVWRRWSEEHPLAAQALWPAVAKLAHQQLYLFTPDVLWLASAESDAERLREQIAVLLGDKYCFLARTHQQLGRHETAVELFTEALQHVPEHRAALVGRAVSLEALGKAADTAVESGEASRP